MSRQPVASIKVNGFLGTVNGGSKHLKCTMLTPKKRPWRDSIAAWFSCAQIHNTKLLAARAAWVVHNDRALTEEFLQQEPPVINKPSHRFSISMCLKDTPFWAITKNHRLVGSTYVSEVRSAGNTNGVIKAFTELTEGIGVIRPDGSRVFQLREAVNKDILQVIWAYYRRHHSFPVEGCAVPFILNDADIEAIASCYGLKTFTVNEKLSVQLLHLQQVAGAPIVRHEHIVTSGQVYSVFVKLFVEKLEDE